MALEPPSWWTSLRHGGLLIAPSRLAEYFPGAPARLAEPTAERLRRDLVRLEGGAKEGEAALLDTVFHKVCGLEAGPDGRWERGSDVDARWTRRAITGETVKPRRIWYGPNGAVLPVFIDSSPRIGVGRGRREVSRVVHWLRQTQQKLALLTNARQWRLIYAGLDFDAWCEWDSELWFEEGRPGPQVDALRVLLSPRTLSPAGPDSSGPLLAAIQESRRGQAELSSELGERVRLAVEEIIRAHGPRLHDLDKAVTPRDIYIAASRLVMRMVVVLFAEARDLLPRDNPAYHGSYGLQGLREILERTAGGSPERLRNRSSAWPRILALFRLVHEGSHHGLLAIPAYGGELFASGDSSSREPMRRALAVFEDASHEHSPSDAVVFRVLSLLCRSRVKVRQGKASTWVDSPVDFSDLSSEYIGILYEGLLDYELRVAQEPMVFLALGDEPLLPLSRLEAMEDGDLAPLVKALTVKKTLKAGDEAEGDEEGEESEAEDGGEAADESESVAERPPTDDAEERTPGPDDARHQARERARRWAWRAVVAGKLVTKPKGKKADRLAFYEQTVAEQAKRLVNSVVLPGEWYLVRWGGTRKGAGTFYTRPQLAVPTVQRTLRPLAYQPPPGLDGHPDENAAPAAWAPRRPEEILGLKICDPAVGSGSFLIASLRFLTDALYASLHHHGRIRAHGDKTMVTLAEGRPSDGQLGEDPLPCRPEAEEFEPRLRARLKRYVVERCLHGVDVDPLATELGRLSLWIETMDKDLPFEFLDHKVKVGNAVVGCWFDRFRDYPARAWDREGGDKSHGNGVHFAKEAWTKAIKAVRNDRIKRELEAWVVGQKSLLDDIGGETPESLHERALAAFREIHALPVHETEARARLYREKLQNDSALNLLRQAFDTWCAIWFWSGADLDSAPTPRTFEKPSEEMRSKVEALRTELHLFHWELEFPDVFAKPGGGFDAVVGNPPWEIQKPNSKEYFTNLDPLYRTYGKQHALARQKEMFDRDRDDERRWLEYNARLKALSNWVKHAGDPFGDADQDPFLGKRKQDLHVRWCQRRSGRQTYSDQEHPFLHVGSADVNTYKLFLEQAHALVRPGGQIGMLVPSGIYTDKGSTELRTLFLTRCRWKWLFGFENRERVFDIDSRFKFAPVIVEKGGATEAIRTAFMRRDLVDWENAEAYAIPYSREQVARFSPHTRAILEIRHPRDLEVLEKIYANSVLLGDQGPDGWGIRYATEFHMTNDSRLFPPRPVWEAKGYRPDDYGRWIGPDGDVALPLYEGRMIDQFDFSAKGWVSGKGRTAVWRDIPWEAKKIEPQFLVRHEDREAKLLEEHLSEVRRREGEDAEGEERIRLENPRERAAWRDSYRRKVGFMDVSSSTNSRTMIAAHLDDEPCGNKVPVLQLRGQRASSTVPILTAILNSFTFDFQLRTRFGGLSLNYFIIAEAALPQAESAPPEIARGIASACLALAVPHPRYAAMWLQHSYSRRQPWKTQWALAEAERLRIRCTLDAVAARLYGLDEEEFRWILRDCDHPRSRLTNSEFTRTLDPKGFWRIDKEKDPECRHTVLSLIAHAELSHHIAQAGGDATAGIQTFLTQRDGLGWRLPDAVCLADYGLGHDERAREAQPVAALLGSTFLPWQLEQSAEESWTECERHARAILGEEGYEHLQAELRGEVAVPLPDGTALAAEGPQGGAWQAQRRLFPGEQTLFGPKTEDPPGGGKRRS